MRIAVITTDNRQERRHYDDAVPEFGTAPEALLQGFAKLPELEIHVVSCLQRPVHSPEKLAENIWYHSLHVGKWGWLRGGYVGCVAAIQQKLQSIRPDVVHGQGTERECSLAAVFSGYPNVVTVHGNMRTIAKVNSARPLSFQWLAARLEAFTLPTTDGVVCITQYTQRAVESLARRTWLLPNAVDEKFFDIVNDPGTPMRILCVGYISKRKNQNALIRALDSLSNRIGFKLVFIGQAFGGTDAYCDEFFELIQTRPWIEYLGLADRDTIRAQMSAASALVLPSLEDNCPMTVLEAMATGIPVAASEVGGIPELLKHDVTGLLFSPRDPDSIRQAIRTIIEDRTTRNRLGNAGRDYAQRAFHPEVIARAHERIYRELLSIVR